MTEIKTQCPEFPHFGATYPDARCIDGYLWDLDSCTDNPDEFTKGGDEPCPFCNTESFIEHNLDEIDEETGASLNNGSTRQSLLVYIEKLRERYQGK